MGSTALRYEAEVMEGGRVELHVPLPSGANVTVFVVPATGDGTDDLLAAAESSMGFWDNPLDDEDWNEA